MHDVRSVVAEKTSNGVDVATGNVTSRRHDVAYQRAGAAAANNRDELDATTPSISPSPGDPAAANLSGMSTQNWMQQTVVACISPVNFDHVKIQLF